MKIKEYVTVASEGEAKRLLNEFEYNKQRNLLATKKDLHFSELLHQWVENYVKYNCEETTAYGYMNNYF